MKKFEWVGCWAVLAFLAGWATPAFAVIGTVDDVPAATLLLPYFEVDLDNPDGVTTLMSINNASATAVLAHVVMWTDLSIHVLDFDIYLTGYDVQSINLRDIIVHGNLPVTASDGQDPGDTISPQGPASEDSNFASCGAFLPYSNPTLNDSFLFDHLQPALTGLGSTYIFGGFCSGYEHGDRIARGYVTVDTESICNTDWPDSAGYFISGGAGTATNQNVLWGDYFYINPEQNFAQGETLVHIEADAALGAASYTFYYRYSGGADNREGLGNVFASRFLTGGDFDGGTTFLTWRDSKRSQNPFSCGLAYPAPFPLGAEQVVVFDEEENFEVPDNCPVSPCPDPEGFTPFPWEAQRTLVGGPDLPSSYSFGWIFMNLNSPVALSQVTTDLGYIMQNWVSPVMEAKGRLSIGFDALQLGNVTDPATAPNPFIPIPGGAPN